MGCIGVGMTDHALTLHVALHVHCRLVCSLGNLSKAIVQTLLFVTERSFFTCSSLCLKPNTFTPATEAERQLQRDEHKRRRTFDPLSPRRAQAPKVSSAPTAPGSDSGDSATTAPSQGPPAARPRMAPGQLAAAAAQPAASDPRSGAPADEDIAALLTSMLADGGVPEVEVLADDEEELEQQLRQRETRAAAEEAARRRSRVAVPARRRRMTPMQLRAAAVMQAAQAAAAAEAAAPAPPAQRAPSAAAAGGPAAAGNSADDLLLRQLTGADDFEDEDELDWDALGQFEQFEEAAKRERQQQEQQRARRERQQQQGRASAPAAALAANPAARAPGQQQRGQQQQAQPSGALERDMDELEGLLGFFEAMETKPQRQAASKGGSGGGGAAGGDDNDIDWAKLESALFGDAWEEDLIAELAAELEGSSDEGEEDGEDGAKAPRGAGAAAADGGRGEEEVEPWADEVSTLLLGLVMQSHQKYLERWVWCVRALSMAGLVRA